MEAKIQKSTELQKAKALAKDQFFQLCAKLQIQQDQEKLFTLLRECYLNPLTYLGPPQAIMDSKDIAHPLVVSKMSWKERRRLLKDKRTCSRCGNKGHTATNCTQQIKCRNCGDAHPTISCNKPKQQKQVDPNAMGIDDQPKAVNRGRRIRRGNRMPRGRQFRRNRRF